MKLLTSLIGLSTAACVLSAHPLVASANPATIQVANAHYATLTSQDPGTRINVRDGAGTNTRARHIAYAGDRVEILDRFVGDDGYMWFQVRFIVSNATGWIRGDYVALDEEPWY